MTETPSLDDAFVGRYQHQLPADTVHDVQHRPGRRRKRDREKKTSKRLDIQGLRMVAVVAVVINHLTDHPVGGFVGVDVFFVISGYLMTGILIREVERSGRRPLRYLGSFYARRARRLLPASLVVIVLTILGAHTVFTSDRFHSTVVDGGWAAAFLANWHSIALGTNYFAADHPPSPLQHYWSLSVEEQFYFGWPLLLLIAALLLGHRRRWTALVCSVAAVVISIAFTTTFHNTIEAYFSTWTRVWELALGGVVFGVAPYIRLRSRGVTILSWTGLVLILISLFVVHPGAGFPFPGAVLPCVGSALALAATSKGARVRNIVLTNRVSVFIGDISYSVYLVHFPLIVILKAYMPHAGVYYYLTVVAATLGSAVLMYAFVELPVLQSNFLRPRAERSVLREFPIPRAQTAVVASAAIVVAMGSLITWPGAQADAEQRLAQIQQAIDPSAATTAQPVGVPAPPSGPANNQLSEELHNALLASSWPSLDPPLDNPSLGQSQKAGCGNTTFDVESCVWGDPNATHTMVLVGDSRSGAYSDGFIKLTQSIPGWRVYALGGADCAFADPAVEENTNVKLVNCPQRNEAVLAVIKQKHPDLLVVTSGNGDPTTDDKVATELAKTQGYVGKYVFLQAPPVTADPNVCYTKTSRPTDCVASLPSLGDQELQNQEKILVPRFHGTLINTTNWFCYHGECPIFVEHVPMRHDAHHITPQYAEFIEPQILEAFREYKLIS